MRITRIITAFVAAFTAAMLGLTMAPSQAATGTADRAAAPQHQIPNLQAGEIRNTGRFYAKGNAVTYKGKKIILQRKNKGARSWSTVQKQRTDASTGRFKVKFRGKCGSKWRLVLKASGGYAKTNVKLGKIICY